MQLPLGSRALRDARGMLYRSFKQHFKRKWFKESPHFFKVVAEALLWPWTSVPLLFGEFQRYFQLHTKPILSCGSPSNAVLNTGGLFDGIWPNLCSHSFPGCFYPSQTYPRMHTPSCLKVLKKEQNVIRLPMNLGGRQN